jgi:hypothetical protein
MVGLVMALSCTAFPIMMLQIYVRSFCPSRVINPYAGHNAGLWHKVDPLLGGTFSAGSQGSLGRF